MAKKLISFDDEAEGLGLPDVVEEGLNATYGTKAEVEALATEKIGKAEAEATFATLSDIFDGGPLKHGEITFDPADAPSRDGTLLLILKAPPTEFFTDFSEYELGAPPNDWTPLWQPSNLYSVVADAAATGGVVLREPPVDPFQQHRAFSWNLLDNRTDIEVVMKWRATAPAAPPRAIVRGSGSGSGRTGYHAGSQNETTSSLQKTVASTTSTTLGSAAVTFAADTWYITRLRAAGTAIASKTWLASSSEPAAWEFEVTDSDIPGPGWSGIRVFSAPGTREFDWFGAAVGGGTAPTEVVPA